MKECDRPDKCKHLEFVWEGYFCRKYKSFIKASKSTFVKYRLSKCKEWTI